MEKNFYQFILQLFFLLGKSWIYLGFVTDSCDSCDDLGMDDLVRPCDG